MTLSMCLFMLRGKEKAKAVVMGSYEMALGGIIVTTMSMGRQTSKAIGAHYCVYVLIIIK
jgi:hypothetical protein